MEEGGDFLSATGLDVKRALLGILGRDPECRRVAKGIGDSGPLGDGEEDGSGGSGMDGGGDADGGMVGRGPEGGAVGGGSARTGRGDLGPMIEEDCDFSVTDELRLVKD